MKLKFGASTKCFGTFLGPLVPSSPTLMCRSVPFLKFVSVHCWFCCSDANVLAFGWALNRALHRRGALRPSSPYHTQSHEPRNFNWSMVYRGISAYCNLLHCENLNILAVTNWCSISFIINVLWTQVDLTTLLPCRKLPFPLRWLQILIFNCLPSVSVIACEMRTWVLNNFGGSLSIC